MKVLVAMDSFKGSLSSLEAGDAVRAGILRAISDAEILVRPLADGGEGTVDALTLGMGGTLQTLAVTGPLGEKVTAQYGILSDGITAIVEMSSAAGLPLVPAALRDPMNTTTYGVGEIILDAAGKGCRRFLVGIGGSATNDGGAGMLQALGFELLDEAGRQIPFGARGLKKLRSIRTERINPMLSKCSFRVACDVNNPLCGDQGASAVFAPQKGAKPDSIPQMDRWLREYAALVRKTFPHADPDALGSGAAGGLGFAFQIFPHAVLESGVKIVLEETRLEESIKCADLVVTGEGRLDAQTVLGKAPIGVAELAKKNKKPVLAFAGCVTPDAALCNEKGIDAYFPILRSAMTLQEAMEPETARSNLSDTAEQVFRALSIRGIS